MNPPSVARPAGVTAIAWLWIAGGILLLVSALLTWAVLSLIGPVTATAAGRIPLESAMISAVSSNIGVLVWTQAALGVPSIVAGVQFLKLRRWARTVIEILTWVSLAYVLINGGYFLYVWESIAADLSKQLMLERGALVTLGYVTMVTLTVIFAAPLGFMLRYLRGAEVKQAIDAAARR